MFFVSHSRNAAAWYISASACCDDASERSLRWAARILTAAAISSGLASRGIFSMSLGALAVTIFIEIVCSYYRLEWDSECAGLSDSIVPLVFCPVSAFVRSPGVVAEKIYTVSVF